MIGPDAAPASKSPARPLRAFYLRLPELGAAAQAAIPAAYAWIVTVAPAAWSRGAPVSAKAAAVLAALTLVVAIWVERLHPARARMLAVWGFVVTSVATWILAPMALSAARFDTWKGITGMVAWGLFALAHAAPPLRPEPDIAEQPLVGAALRPRGALPRGDAALIVVGAVLALAVQAIGWRIPSNERALLVRASTLASGLAILGAATAIAVARHSPRSAPSPRARMRRALPLALVLVLLAVGGVLYRTDALH